MFQLVYISKAKNRLGEPELLKMMANFRARNTANEITGLLLYDGKGTFIQLLEGEVDAVQALYSCICQDPRHERINKLHEQTVEKRMFAQWQMGFKRLDKCDVIEQEGMSEFLNQEDGFDYLQHHPEFSIQLLHYFRQC
ncbi:BLUF domain-containing protein [Pseudoalteromonas umbrosa]|uniref:BLUF domain-containing protein n=1 Tax=Pseudoalteromonas umbrosa TaxID=3048489 RepID=UPI0024C3B3E7|nr:BLUF domain-containing protein [Pseudoalteromonas sp. B95]MDK1290592.1 BLUF domain-containing protein [Pseudoalteromonas sp. B95]